MHSEILISKAQYMLEVEHHWRVAERMMGAHHKVGWVSRSVLAQATNDLSMISDDCEPDDVLGASAMLRTK